MNRILRLNLVVLAIIAIFSSGATAQQPTNDPFEKLAFLLGTWSGAGSGKPGDVASGEATYSYDLAKKVIVRRNRAEFVPKPGEKTGAVHEDLMIIYAERGQPGLHATYLDSEGNVIHYTLSFPEKQPAVVFESEASARAPRFRLVNELTAPGVMTSDFLIAPPGGDFKSYVKGTVIKKPAAARKL